MKKRRSKSWAMAYCGMAAALCVALMLLGTIIPIAMFIAPAVASFLIATVCMECGITMAWTDPEYLILDEPTRGIDVGTKVDIQKLVLKLAGEGMSVTFISSETDEMLRTCSRLIVMRDRRVVGELSGEDLTQTKIMSTIAGGESKNE